jgi:cell division protein FtsL
MSAPPVKIAVVGLAIAAGLVMMLGIAHVNRRQEVIHLGYELSTATEELTRLQEENRRLRLEKAALTNPERIRRLAESLGMSHPGSTQIRVVRDGDELARVQAGR